MYGEGVSHAGELLDIGLELGILEKRASYYYYEGELLDQGRENTKTYFAEHPELAQKVETLIRQKSSGTSPLEVGVTETEPEENAVAEDEN